MCNHKNINISVKSKDASAKILYVVNNIFLEILAKIGLNQKWPFFKIATFLCKFFRTLQFQNGTISKMFRGTNYTTITQAFQKGMFCQNRTTPSKVRAILVNKLSKNL